MNTTESTEQRRPASLGAALRSHPFWFAGIGLLVAIGVAAIGELSRSNQPQYHAEALVVANELAVPVESLPKTAVAVFETAETAAIIADVAGTGIDPASLIPDIVRAEPVETTTIVEVDAIYPDPELAALYANTGALALTRELNRIGPGLGSFSVQTWALVPETPIPKSRRQLAVAAVIAGTAVALGAAAIYAHGGRSRRAETTQD